MSRVFKFGRGMSVNVEGLDDLWERLDKLPDDVRAGSHRAIHEAAEAVEEQMRDDVPVDTGTLRDSIQSQVYTERLNASVGPMGDDAYYGYFVEFGTSKMSPQPFATPAAEQERGRFADRFRQHVGDELK